ncbi:MAG: hypothetical protein LBF32_01030 [Streptococcaceae bacterium]|nr:hypothetical protein [Streptococcaceae bacterium]
MSSYGALGTPLVWGQRLHEAGFFNIDDQRSFQPGAEKYAASLAGLTLTSLDTQDKLIDFLELVPPIVEAVIQRCQVHKKRNVLSKLPESEQANVGLLLSALPRI